MAYYQAQRTLLDLVNCIELPYGCYVKTDCIKWVRRFGPNLRPLAIGEQPKPTFLLKEITDTVEDRVVDEVKTVDEDVLQVETVVVPAESSRKWPKRRKPSA